ncbi:MAG TPA: dodecin family protein [Microbacterium sp.]|jgi:flavin-binding protein dodecin|nr:dodecin family protein [Microbacterium sp.]
MSTNTVARITTISSRSAESFDHATREGIARAHATLRNVSGAWIKEQKVECADGAITSFNVVLEVTFVLDD